MSHTVTQCTVVLELSSKDTRPYPNTLLIRSLPGVNFWVFHPRNLTPFLIRLTQTFTFHYYFFIIFLFFHLMHFSQFLSFLHTTMMQMLTRNHAIHCRSRAFIEGYASAPKYTLHSESSQCKLLGLSL